MLIEIIVILAVAVSLIVAFLWATDKWTDKFRRYTGRR